MSVDNLATVFGPTVVGYSSAEPTMNDIMTQTKLQQLVRNSLHFVFLTRHIRKLWWTLKIIVACF